MLIPTAAGTNRRQRHGIARTAGSHPLGRPSRHRDAEAGERGDRQFGEHAGLHQHAQPRVNRVQEIVERAAGLGWNPCASSRRFISALHHASKERATREWVVGGLKSGALKAVVGATSLDLGVDFLPVERVLQIGSPKGVARLSQFAGRFSPRAGAGLAHPHRAKPQP